MIMAAVKFVLGKQAAEVEQARRRASEPELQKDFRRWDLHLECPENRQKAILDSRWRQRLRIRIMCV